MTATPDALEHFLDVAWIGTLAESWAPCMSLWIAGASGWRGLSGLERWS
jgi:hypothetical protein